MGGLFPVRFQRLIAIQLPLFTVFVCGLASAQTPTQFFPLADVRPGMKGVGRTIFEGNKIQEFQVELIGVVKDVIAPKHDLVLARLSGPVIQEAGVIAGMSGSPVYVNGKLLGAVAMGFPLAKEPYTLITPIQDMLNVTPAQSAKPGSQMALNLPWYSSEAPSLDGTLDRWIPTAESGPQLWKSMLRRWTRDEPVSRFRLPLDFSGFDPRVVSEYQPLFESLGLQPEEAAVLSSAGGSDETSASPSDLSQIAPGSMISLLLIRGDLNLEAGCTVTYRQGNNIYACGHPVLSMGPSEIPFAQARVLATIPLLTQSTKIDAPGRLVGTIRQDRFGAIYGVLGDQAPVIPIHLHLASSLNRSSDYNFQVAQQPLLSPILVNMALVSALSGTERMEGPSTLDLKGSIELGDGESINLEDVISSNLSSAGAAGALVATPLSYLLDGQYPNLRIKSIDLNVASQDESRIATLEQVWSTQSEVRPGDHILVTALERTPSGARLSQTIPVAIPQNVNDKTLSLVVGSGSAINALELRFIRPGNPPNALHQLVRELNRTRRDNRVYALLMAPQRSFVMEGTDFPSPPPSLLQTFLADPAVSSKISYRAGSVVGDFDTKPLPYTIDGEETLYLKVLDAAK